MARACQVVTTATELPEPLVPLRRTPMADTCIAWLLGFAHGFHAFLFGTEEEKP
jgi:hypothetical protein